MKIGELVYSGRMMEMGHLVLGIVLEKGTASGPPMYRIFWVDAAHPEWYYESEVEIVDAPR